MPLAEPRRAIKREQAQPRRAADHGRPRRRGWSADCLFSKRFRCDRLAISLSALAHSGPGSSAASRQAAVRRDGAGSRAREPAPAVAKVRLAKPVAPLSVERLRVGGIGSHATTAAAGLRGQQLDLRLCVLGRLCALVGLRRLQGAVGGEHRPYRVRDRGARPRPMVDPGNIGIGPEANPAMSDHMPPVTEPRSRSLGGLEDRLSIDLLAQDWDLERRPLTNQLNLTRRAAVRSNTPCCRRLLPPPPSSPSAGATTVGRPRDRRTVEDRLRSQAIAPHGRAQYAESQGSTGCRSGRSAGGRRFLARRSARRWRPGRRRIRGVRPANDLAVQRRRAPQ